jgi:oligopeptide transport system substrate-binding protein
LVRNLFLAAVLLFLTGLGGPAAARRAAYLAQAERITLTDAPIAPIYFYVNKNLVNPRVGGWVDNLVDHHRSRYLCTAN